MRSEPPMWAKRLLGVVAVDYGRKTLPQIVWRHLTGEHSYGVTSRGGNRIFISAGTDIELVKHVFVHELAHWLTWGQEADPHGPMLYATVYALQRRYRVVPMKLVRRLEASRRPSLVAAYWPSRR